MPARIKFRDAKGLEGLIELGGDPVYVGRAPDCAIRTDDALVSRRHSRIRREDQRFWIEDLDSSNGTKVNEVKVQRHMLVNNDSVVCGSLILRYIEDVSVLQASPAGSSLPAAPPISVPVAAPPPPPPAPPAVDMSAAAAEMQRLRDAIETLRLELDDARSEREKQIADNMRLRAEHTRFQQRLEDARTQLVENAEVVEEHKRLVAELRPEIDLAKQAQDKALMDLAHTTEREASLGRQLAREKEDTNKLKAELEKQKRTIAELSATKDLGLKKLNEHLAETEQVRQVVNEQERMLEERRVGLITLEETLKELRQKADQRHRENAQLRAERDELKKRVSELEGGG